MGALTIELGEEKEPTLCEFCGNKTRSVHGFVFNDRNAYAVYCATWTIGHLERGVSIAIGLGEWGEGSSPTQRYSVGLVCRATDSQIRFTVIDPEQSPWANVSFVGKMLRREEALAHPAAGEFFHVAEHIVIDDPRVPGFVKMA